MFGDYELRGLIGRGGMGDVHRAYDTRRGREVALKLLPAHLANDRRLVERFRREARALARFTDPNIVPVHDYGEIDGRLFIDMALVAGRDLATVLAGTGPLDPARAVRIMEQAASALDTAHRNEVVHRDVKPSNLLVLTDRGDFTYLVDFGIAHAVGTALTSTGSTVGTLAYMAPERFTSENAVDGRADVYALTCVLFQMLTGEHPFPFDGAPALLHAHLNAPPPSVTGRRPELSPEWDRVIARGMAKDPDARFPTAGALAVHARAALGPWRPGPGPTVPRAVEPASRLRRPAVWALGAVVAVIAVVAAVLVGQRVTAEPAAPTPEATPATSTVDPGSTYVTYRDAARRFSLDVPAVLTAQPTSDGARFTTQGTNVLVQVTVARGPDLGTAETRLAVLVTAFEVAGGTVTASGRDATTYSVAGTDAGGNRVVSRSRLTGDAAGTVTWTYPPVDEVAWAAFVDRSSASLTLS